MFKATVKKCYNITHYGSKDDQRCHSNFLLKCSSCSLNVMSSTNTELHIFTNNSCVLSDQYYVYTIYTQKWK